MKTDLKTAYEALKKHQEINTFDLSKENKIHAQVLFDEANRRSGKWLLKTIDWNCSNCVSVAKLTVFNMMNVLATEMKPEPKLKSVADKMVVNDEPTHKDLVEKAKSMGIKIKGNISKANLIKLIEDYGNGK